MAGGDGPSDSSAPSSGRMPTGEAGRMPTGEAGRMPTGEAGRMKVFVSYSRDDVAFADQLSVALEDRGFEPILDRHNIDAAENWRERLGALILSCDAVAFVLKIGRAHV